MANQKNDVMKKMVLIIFLFNFHQLYAQSVELIFHKQAADGLLEWFGTYDRSMVDKIADYPANQLMEQVCQAHADSVVSSFAAVMQEFNAADSTTGKIYGLRKAWQNREAIKQLMDTLSVLSVANNAVRSASRYLPQCTKDTLSVNIYFTVTGWQWGDAMQMLVLEKDGHYFSDKNGEPVILFNLALINELYGDNLNQKIASFQEVLAHELFHVLFTCYARSHWPLLNFSQPEVVLKYLLMNEGMAHYIAQRDTLFRAPMDSMYRQRESRALTSLNKRIIAVMDSTQSLSIRMNVVYQGVYGKFWEKDICIAGLFMAFHIEHTLGMEQLVRCVQNGPDDFIKTYQKVAEHDTQVPLLSDAVF